MLDPRLGTFHDYLAREIRSDLSGVESFETEHDLRPYFRQYYKNWLSEGSRLKRTLNGVIARRSAMPAFVERLKAKFGPTPRVLDIGCGYASDTLFLTWLGCEVVAVDPVDFKIDVCRHRAAAWRDFLGEDAPQPTFLCGRLEDIESLQPGGFAGAFASECLHHCEPVENTLLAMRSLLNANGEALVLESNGANIANEAKLGRRTRRQLVEAAGRYSMYGNENIRTPWTWRGLFRDCGFRVEETRYSRHLLSEALATLAVDDALCRLPGAALSAIHVAFSLRPNEG